MIRFYFLLSVFIYSLALVAQDDDGSLTFRGRNFYNNKELLNTTIKVVSDNKTITQFNTKSSNNFKTVLNFGKTYDLYFINSSTQTMFIRIFADIPKDKRNYNITYELKIPFFPKDDSKIDTVNFLKPFHQIVFDGKSKFVDDTVYMNTFIANIYKKEPIADTTVPFITTEKIKEYVQLAGILKLDNDKQTPLKNKAITLNDEKGDVIAKSQTTHNGTFVFQNIDVANAQSIQLKLNDGDNPTNAKVKLENSKKEAIQAVNANQNQSFVFSNAIDSSMIKKIVDQNYKYNIAGKLITTNGISKSVLADKNVYLIGSKDNLIQKVKTNDLGNFLFTKIVPGQEYSIGFDSSDIAAGNYLDLYSTKDKFISRLDTKNGNKFMYKFLSVSTSSFNDLVIDDAELKMKVKGKLYGDNKQNPLSNLKVLLLNERFETIDSATTNSSGDFAFNHSPYTKQLLLTAENEKNILESFNNILVFDNNDNLIKMVSLIKGKKFNYKPLPTEQSRIADSYIDDAWMALIDRQRKESAQNNQTIIENILFEFNKSDLLPQSQQTLDKIVIVMNAKKDFKIELSAHSDSKGGDAYNLKLSEQRAKSAKDYITSKGIEASRIIAKGFGETKLLNNCGNNSICSDDEHAVNRRLEFKIIFN